MRNASPRNDPRSLSAESDHNFHFFPKIKILQSGPPGNYPRSLSAGSDRDFYFLQDQILASKNKCIASEVTKNDLAREEEKVNLGVLSATVALRLAVLTTYLARALS